VANSGDDWTSAFRATGWDPGAAASGAASASGSGAAGTGSSVGAAAGTGALRWAMAAAALFCGSIQTASTSLLCSARRSSPSVSRNLVFQKGWLNQEPSSDWTNMPSRRSSVLTRSMSRVSPGPAAIVQEDLLKNA